MGYEATIILDSVNTTGDRLTTFSLTYPRFIHSEFMAHRTFSRNAASSRAIPVEKTITQVLEDPALPVWWGRRQQGMQAYAELRPDAKLASEATWLQARDAAVRSAMELLSQGLHKQIVNRILEPWMWITMIASATTWSNFFSLRQDSALPPNLRELRGMVNPQFPAQPEMQVLAYLMREAYRKSEPREVELGVWHLPLVEADVLTETPSDVSALLQAGYDMDALKAISVGRCARVSYMTHLGVRDPKEDIQLHDRLLQDHHWSPFEHIAQAAPGVCAGNFMGWMQYRKEFEGESGA